MTRFAPFSGSRLGSFLVAIVLALAGCMSQTPDEDQVYSEYRQAVADGRINRYAEEHYDDGAATWLSVLFPGLGHFYLGEPGRAFLWLTAGLPSWPLFVPAIVANHDAEVLNKRHVVEAYLRWKKYAAPAAGPASQVSSQNNNQNQNVNVSAPPVVTVVTPVTIVGQGGSATQAPADPQLGRPVAPPLASCQACAAAGAAGKRFCSECGRAVAAPDACPKCHAPLAQTARFCDQCGSQR